MSVKKLNILLYSHSARYGGAEHALLRLVGAVDAAHFRKTVVVPGTGPMLDAFRHVPDTCCIQVHEATSWLFQHEGLTADLLLGGVDDLEPRVQEIVSLIRENETDVVMSNSIACVEGALAAAIAGKPHVWHVLEMPLTDAYFQHKDAARLVMRLICDLSRTVIAVSETVAAQYRAVAPMADVRVVHTGIDADAFVAGIDRGLSKESVFGSHAGQQVVLFAGQFIVRKGIDVLVKAIPMVVEACPQTVFVLSGDSQTEDGIRALGQIPTSVQDRVKVLGHRTDIPVLLNLADIVVLPSVADPLPLVVLEAMAAGRPVVGTRSGGMEEQIVDRETGRLVLPGDVGQLADAIISLLKDEAARVRMGDAARQRVLQHFSLKSMASQFQEVLHDAAQHAVAPSAFAAEMTHELTEINMLRREVTYLRQFKQHITSHPAWRLNRAMKSLVRWCTLLK